MSDEFDEFATDHPGLTELEHNALLDELRELRRRVTDRLRALEEVVMAEDLADEERDRLDVACAQLALLDWRLGRAAEVWERPPWRAA